MSIDELFEKKLSYDAAKNLIQNFIMHGVSELKLKKQNNDIFNKIYDECLPTIYLASYFKIDFLTFILSEEKHHDALFFIGEQSIEIECVTAMNQENNALRMQKLREKKNFSEEKTLSTYGEIKIEEEGTKNKGRIIKHTRLVSYKSLKESHIKFLTKEIEKSILKKITLQHDKGIYQNTILIVYIDDRPASMKFCEFTSTLTNIARSIRKNPHKFKGIYIVGTSGNVTPIFRRVFN